MPAAHRRADDPTIVVYIWNGSNASIQIADPNVTKVRQAVVQFALSGFTV